ncbi:sodium-independent sulfate anion transporter-like isoform X2 [Uranotaenia lowii]|uniref:sodium-independent sulfate anion transporter-like isoform X2 n=1 Tax=Uranotaenia lowii TaxID=190385 RepID=UPI0024790D18|nr:sodium-independent sulfate anion transporter-like isoform X2 [Uranotaenia lowii]XP_055586512.1 sodium-independent sulfate anion transporter-like isoform X2 [Uranotaenia lowii]XP_055586513.1 sodium-independent sulfate anion transporter-like isoform X2 [Uranotaenia lowii]
MVNEEEELNQLRGGTGSPETDQRSNDTFARLKRRVHILNWLPSYGREDLISDAIAGITLGLTIIPQSIAYAGIAGVPSQYGLYAAFMGSLVYILFGTVKEVSIGPTSLMSILTVQYTAGKPVQYVIILASLAGLVELLMGVLKLGFLVSFIPIPVTSAFTSATSIIIIGTQLKNLLGISVTGKGFFDTVYALSGKLTETSIGDLTLGCVGCFFLLGMKQLTQIPINEGTRMGKFWKKFLWYLSLARNALIVVISSFVAFKWSSSGEEVPFKLSGHVKQGIPSFELPVYGVQLGNSTISYVEVVKELGSSIIVIPLVAVLANVSIAKAFSAGKIVDASQEMIALGLCNILGSCFSSMPTCGAFTRSAVSHSSGVRTPLAGLYSAIITLLALSLLTPYFYYIPKTTLAAVLICSVVFMIDFKIVDTLRQSSKIDTIAWFGCFCCSLLLGVEVGLLFGVLICVLGLLKVWARPTIRQNCVEQAGFRYVKLSPEAGLFFPAVDFLRTKVLKVAIAEQVPIVVDCSAVIGLDHTSTKGLRELAKELEKVKQRLILLNLQPGLKKLLKGDDPKGPFSFWEDEGDGYQSNVQSIRL